MWDLRYVEVGDWRVDDLVKDVETIEKWVNEFKTLETLSRVIPDHIVKGKLVPGRVIPGRPARPASKKTKLHVKADLFEILEAWREEQTIDGVHSPVSGWLFGNVVTGRQFWRGMLQKDHLVPAGKAVGIANLGWHDFRHTYRAMMDEEKISLEEQRTLMRHEDVRTTLGYGGKSKAETVRGAMPRS